MMRYGWLFSFCTSKSVITEHPLWQTIARNAKRNGVVNPAGLNLWLLTDKHMEMQQKSMNFIYIMELSARYDIIHLPCVQFTLLKWLPLSLKGLLPALIAYSFTAHKLLHKCCSINETFISKLDLVYNLCQYFCYQIPETITSVPLESKHEDLFYTRHRVGLGCDTDNFIWFRPTFHTEGHNLSAVIGDKLTVW